jgi:hypothetical protein
MPVVPEQKPTETKKQWRIVSGLLAVSGALLLGLPLLIILCPTPGGFQVGRWQFECTHHPGGGQGLPKSVEHFDIRTEGKGAEIWRVARGEYVFYVKVNSP